MKFKLQLFTIVGMVLTAASALAAPPPPPPTPIPIDGGLSLLVAGCVGYGAKKIYDKKKKDQNP
ncbi:MAG: PID-CTERM protein-sorting domain-containing protein [Bacteroidota bacterium]|jgi:hypothetical protein